MRNRILNTARSLAFFDRWSLFYVVVLLAASVYNYVYNFQHYSFADMYINYQGGFVRRGLLGEILYWLYCCGANPVHVAVVLCVVAYMAVVVFLVRGFCRKGYALGLLCVSFLVGGVGIFGISFFRRDFIELCLLIMIVWSWTKMRFGLWVVIGNVLTIVAILCHEPYAFYGLPIAVLLARQRTGVFQALLCWLPSFASFVLCLHYSGNAAVYEAIRHSTESFVYYPNIIEFFTYNPADVMRMHMYYNFAAVIDRLPTVIGSVGSIVLVLYFGANATSQYSRKTVSGADRLSYFSLLLFVMLCQLPMFTVLSIDFTRTCMYASVSAYIVFFGIGSDSCARLFPQWYRSLAERVLGAFDRLVPPTRLKILALVLFVGTVQHNGQGSLGLLRDSELGNMVMVLYKLVRLGVSCCL